MDRQYYGVFDTRPQHSNEPYTFHLEKGKINYAMYHSREMADFICGNMNRTGTLTTYVVKELTETQYFDLLGKEVKTF